jgi:hypothetical protein
MRQSDRARADHAVWERRSYLPVGFSKGCLSDIRRQV